jgi:pyridoxine 4-dehydrogenase
MTRAVTIPLSFEQEWFYLRYLLRPGEGYPLTIAYDISGHLDTRAFRLALPGVIARHPAILLTVCDGDPSAPRQRVNGSGSLIQEPLVQLVTCESRAQFQAYARAAAKHDQQARWIPYSGPQYQFRLLRRSATEHIFLGTFSHMNMDFTALRIFEGDLWQLYSHFAAGTPADLGEPASLVSAIRGQADRYRSRARAANADYWDRRSAVLPPVWQYAYQPGVPRRAESAWASLKYGEPAAGRLRQACRAAGCSVFDLVLSVTAWLAFQMTYQDRLAIYIAVNARHIIGKSMAGMFSAVRPALFRRVPGGPGDFLGQARREVTRTLAHHYVHGADEIAATMRSWSRWGVEPRRTLSVNYIKAPPQLAERAVPPDVSVGVGDYFPSLPASPAGLRLVVFDTEDTLRLRFNYNPTEIPEAVMSRLAGSFEDGLRAVVHGMDDVSPAEAGPRVARSALTPLLDRDGAIGLHADLEEVRAILERHPSVVAADVRVERHPDGGSEVIADLRVTTEVAAEELRAFCLDWPAATIFAIPPARFRQVTAAAGPARGPAASAGAAPSPASRSLLLLLMEMLPGAGPESEFWAAGGSFAAITRFISRARESGLPEPDYRHFAAPGSLAGIAERIAAASGPEAISRSRRPDHLAPVAGGGAAPLAPAVRLGFGTMRLTGPGAWGEPPDRRAMIRILRRAAELGVEFFDTADSYGPFVSEDIIARALYPYNGVTVATKGGLVRTGPDQWHPVGRPEYLRQCVEMSLRRLRQEAIELYQLHRVDPAVPLADQLGALDELRAAGKIVRIGLSEVTVEVIAEARRITAIASVQNRYNVLDRRCEDVLDYCERQGITFIPWCPLGAGRLTGPGSPLAAAAAGASVTPVQFALAWLLRRSPVMLPIPGTRSARHLAENMAAATLNLTEEQVLWSDQATRSIRLPSVRNQSIHSGLTARQLCLP